MDGILLGSSGAIKNGLRFFLAETINHRRWQG